MPQLLFRDADVFAFSSGLVIVSTDCLLTKLLKSLKVGRQIEIRRADGSKIRSEIAGITMGGGIDPARPFNFSLPRGATKEGIEIGSEIWSVE